MLVEGQSFIEPLRCIAAHAAFAEGPVYCTCEAIFACRGCPRRVLRDRVLQEVWHAGSDHSGAPRVHLTELGLALKERFLEGLPSSASMALDGYLQEIFIPMAKALDFIDPDRLSMTVVLTAMNRFINEPGLQKA